MLTQVYKLMFFWLFFVSVFWEGVGRHFGGILELKIHQKSIKKGVDFSIDFLMDFGRVLGMILGAFLVENSIKNL